MSAQFEMFPYKKIDEKIKNENAKTYQELFKALVKLSNFRLIFLHFHNFRPQFFLVI